MASSGAGTPRPADEPALVEDPSSAAVSASGASPMRPPPAARCHVVPFILIIGLITHASAQPARAQQSTLAPGTKIRVELRNGDRRQGRVIRSGRDTLLAEWAGGSTPAFPVSDIAKLEAVTGRYHPVGRAAVVGAVVGGSLGAIFGGLLYKPCESTEVGGCFLPRKPQRVGASERHPLRRRRIARRRRGGSVPSRAMATGHTRRQRRSVQPARAAEWWTRRRSGAGLLKHSPPST
jgi:hypothetical protein